MDVVRLGIFTPSVLLDVARSTGGLAGAGLEVCESAVPSSPAQFASLRDGDYDAVFTSPDNVLAYRFLPGNPLGRLLDVEMVAGLDRGLGLCLGARPGLGGRDELRGGRLGVDVPTSGFAFVAYALLDRLGLARTDYEVVALGSTPQRAAVLRAGGCEVTVLNAGNELSARSHGCALLAEVTELGPYLGTVVARMRRGHAVDAVDRLVVVLGDTARAMLAGDLDAQAVRAAQRVLGLDGSSAAEHLAVLKDPARGLIGDGAVDAPALQTLLGLRRRFLPVPELDDLATRFEEVVRAGMLVGGHSRTT